MKTITYTLTFCLTLLLFSCGSNHSQKNDQTKEEKTIKTKVSITGQWLTEGNGGVVSNWFEFSDQENHFYTWHEGEEKPKTESGTFQLVGDSIIQLNYIDNNEGVQYQIKSIDQEKMDVISLGINAGNLVYYKKVYAPTVIEETPTQITGTLTSIEVSDFWGRVYLRVTDTNQKKYVFDYYDTAGDGIFEEAKKLLNQEVIVPFDIEKKHEEMDLHINGASIHGEYAIVKPMKKDEAIKNGGIEGTLLVSEEDRSGDLPSEYRFINKQGDTIEITTFVYDKHIENNGKEAIVFLDETETYVAKSVISSKEDPNKIKWPFDGVWLKEDSDNPIDPTQLYININEESLYKVSFGNDDISYDFSVEKNGTLLSGNGPFGSTTIELVSQNPFVINYSDNGRGGAFQANKDIRFIKKETKINHYICYKGNTNSDLSIWISFTEGENGALQVKYKGGDSPIDLRFKENIEQPCDGCAYPTIEDVYEELIDGEVTGTYKLTHSGNWDYVEYTRGYDKKIFKFTIDHNANPYGKTACF